ncbi:MAG TPA: SLBB domain-containing protein, partial [Spirochaetia bacterium]|nr:SLBB domain-containing protein [Spirochaetia bacterium]
MAAPLTEAILRHGTVGLEAYEASGGYQGLRKAIAMEPAEVQDVVKKSGLRGRGGAGFPTGQKWSFVPMGDSEAHYFVVNADEKEPGTMKDRFLMEGNPHQLVEGAIIAARAVKAQTAYIFLRREYLKAAAGITRAIQEAYQKRYLGQGILGSSYSLEMRLHLSVGRYMCGEETGLINALEGRRATPRNKPPYPQTSGLWGKPTVVNNAETVCNLPHILREGPDWYKALSASPDAGTKMFGVSGRVKRPGVWELPMGTPIREILYGHAGGMADGLEFRALIPGGASTEFLGPEHLDLKMEFDSVVKAGSRLGTGTMVVLDNKTCPVGMVLNLERFFARESCGWCTP